MNKPFRKASAQIHNEYGCDVYPVLHDYIFGSLFHMKSHGCPGVAWRCRSDCLKALIAPSLCISPVSKSASCLYCRLRYKQLPCLNVGRTNKEIWLPLEVCHLAKGQQGRMKLDREQQDKMVKVAAQPPANRLRWIQDCMGTHARLNEDPSVQAFGMEISNSMATVRLHSPQHHTATSMFGGN